MKDYKHVTAMADYALRIREQLASVNEHSFNNFRLRVGINIGPVTSINLVPRCYTVLETIVDHFRQHKVLHPQRQILFQIRRKSLEKDLINLRSNQILKFCVLDTTDTLHF